MNFLAHYFLATQAVPAPPGPPDAYTVGTALPDLLPLASPRRRFRPTLLETAPRTNPEEQALWTGVWVHLTTDQIFHRTLAFAEAQTAVGTLLPTAGFTGMRVRAFFLTHVLVELALDAVLIRRYPEITDAFYGAFMPRVMRETARWATAAIGHPLPALSGVLSRFALSRYLDTYRQDAGLAEGLHRVSLRARQEAFLGDNRERLTALVSTAVGVVGIHADTLLQETGDSLRLHYPPTTEK